MDSPTYTKHIVTPEAIKSDWTTLIIRLISKRWIHKWAKYHYTLREIGKKNGYLRVETKLIFHFPSFPDPCWVAVLAGEYIITCKYNRFIPSQKTPSSTSTLIPKNQFTKKNTFRARCSSGIPETLPISPRLQSDSTTASVEKGRPTRRRFAAIRAVAWVARSAIVTYKCWDLETNLSPVSRREARTRGGGIVKNQGYFYF